MEPGGTRGASEDLVLLEVQGDAWGPAQEEEARHLQEEARILLDENVEYHKRKDNEYPYVPSTPQNASPAERLMHRDRLRRLEALKNKGRKR